MRNRQRGFPCVLGSRWGNKAKVWALAGYAPHAGNGIGRKRSGDQPSWTCRARLPGKCWPADVPTIPTTEPTVRDEIEKIRTGRYAPMPRAQRSTISGSSDSGKTTVTVKNSTPYELSVYYDGSVSTKLTLSPGASQELDLAPGTFRVAGRVAAANVLPFYAEETYTSSTSYSMTFYTRPQ
jgi:hypothetical protein